MAGKKPKKPLGIVKPNQHISPRGDCTARLAISSHKVSIPTQLKSLLAAGYLISPLVIEVFSILTEERVVEEGTLVFLRALNVTRTGTPKQMSEIREHLPDRKLKICSIPAILAALLEHSETFSQVQQTEAIVIFFMEAIISDEHHYVLCLSRGEGGLKLSFTTGHPNIKPHNQTMMVFAQAT